MAATQYLTFHSNGAGGSRSWRDATTGTGEFVLTGSGFGTNANFAPAKFLDFINKTEGGDYVEAGFDAMNTAEEDASYQVTNLDGLTVGGGCWEATWNHQGSVGQPEMFGHESLDFDPTEEITVFKHYRLINRSSIANGSQYKGIRVLPNASNEGVTQYSQNSAAHASIWFYDAGDYYQGGYFTAGGVDTNATQNGNASGANFPSQRDGTWTANFFQGKMNSDSGVSDGLFRNWMDGKYTHEDNAIAYRNDAIATWRRVQHNPGNANAMGDADWTVRHARIVIIRGLGWVAFGNASTFSACTDLIVVEPTAWSDTEISGNFHGTRPSGYNWAYVMDSTGTLVNSNGLTSFMGV